MFIDEFVEAAATAAGECGGSKNSKVSDSSANLETNIREGIELHPSIAALAMRGYSQDRLLKLLQESSARLERPRRWQECLDKDVPRAVKSAKLKRQKNFESDSAKVPPPPTPSTRKIRPEEPETALNTIVASSFAGQVVPEQQWLAPGMIPVGQVCLFSGDGGLGKSLGALQLSVGVATGTTWLSIPVKKGLALYLSCEDELSELHRRLVPVSRNAGKELADLSGLHLAPLAETDALLAAPSKTKQLAMTGLYVELQKLVEVLRPTLLVLDSLADVFGGNEINRAEVRWFIGQLRKLCHASSCTIIILAHPSLSGMSTGSGLSGSTHWNNSVRSRLYLTGDKDDSDLRYLEVMKNNRGRNGKKLELRWRDGVFINCSADGTPTAVRESNIDRMFLALVVEFERQGRFLNASGGTTYAPKVFAETPEAKARRFTKADFRQSMERHFAAARITVSVRKMSGHARQYIARTDPQD